MSKKNCKGIYNKQTGLWLTGYTTNASLETTSYTWGAAESALCLNDEQIGAVINAMGKPPKVTGAVVPDEGF